MSGLARPKVLELKLGFLAESPLTTLAPCRPAAKSGLNISPLLICPFVMKELVSHNNHTSQLRVSPISKVAGVKN